MRICGSAWQATLTSNKYADLIGRDIDAMVLMTSTVLSEYDGNRRFTAADVADLEKRVLTIELQFANLKDKVEPFIADEYSPERKRRRAISLTDSSESD